MAEEERAGWRVDEWAELVGIGRSRTWELIKSGDVASAKVGAARIITESPREFLLRHAATPAKS